MRKEYERYKPTGIEWISQIPAHWKVSPIKRIFDVFTGATPDSNNPEYWNGKIVWITPADFSSKQKYIKTGEKFITKEGYLSCATRLVPSESIIFSKRAPVGKVVIAKKEMCTSQGCLSCVKKQDANANELFFYYSFLTIEKWFNAIAAGTTFNEIGTAVFSNTKILVPPRKEQDQIVRFLDWKVSSINKLISTLRKKKSLLRELQRRNNNEVMCPKEGWTSGPLKKYALRNQESLSANTPHDTQIRYIDISTVGNGYLKTAPVTYVFKDAPLRARRVVHSGDTIISTVRTYLRSVCFLQEQYEGCIASTGLSVLTPKSGVMPELLGYALTSDNFISQVIKESIGVSYPAISDNKLMCLKVVFPSNPSEQKCLVERLYNMNQLTNSAIKTTESQIESLQALKIRVIADTVTGKIDVRNITVPEYEHVEDTADDGSEDESEEDENVNGEEE